MLPWLWPMIAQDCWDEYKKDKVLDLLVGLMEYLFAFQFSVEKLPIKIDY